jgi:hypothetical protein
MFAKKQIGILAAAIAALAFGGSAVAGNSTTQTVTYEVQAINEISTSGSPNALVVSTATAGSQPDQVSNALTTYAITTNQARKITAGLDSDMPSGVLLKVNLASGGTSAGDVTLSGTDATVVSAVGPIAESGKAITYKLSASVDAGVVASAQKTVTFTIVEP